MKILVTGCAGFIGSNLCDKLLEDKSNFVVGIDNFNDYYDPLIKKRNIKNALGNEKFRLCELDILNFEKLNKVFSENKFDTVIHLAARAGVRASIKNPLLYAQVNTLGSVNMLRCAVDHKVRKFVLGSSSSVYGNSKHIPFTEDDACSEIISPYGASKRSAEIFAESFYKNYGLKTIILRFFTVYGPRGRIDMAPYLFIKSVAEGRTVSMFGDGSSLRDYTYVDDIVGGIIAALNKDFGFEIVNLGNNKPVKLSDFIKEVENSVDKKAVIKNLPIQMGDAAKTWANINKANSILGWKPKVKIKEGLEKYIKWLGGT